MSEFNDLISRSALLEGAMAERYEFLREKNGNYDHYTDGFEDAMLYVEDAPAVDAVEVVRCKDCKHTDTDGCGAIYCEKWDRWEMPEDFFCSYGKRRGEG